MVEAANKLTINDILKDIRLKSLTEKEKGTEFERLMQRWFLSDSRYSYLKKVWLWEEFPGRKDLGRKDLGIDLVAMTELGDYWAIQCKCYAEDAAIDKAKVDSFLANASRTFTDGETFQTKEFSNLIWVSTSRKKWGPNAEEAIRHLSKQFTRISLDNLEESRVDWEKIVHGKQGKEVRLSPKTPLPHQREAIKKARQYFVDEGNERGKLIMACGTEMESMICFETKVRFRLLDRHTKYCLSTICKFGNIFTGIKVCFTPKSFFGVKTGSKSGSRTGSKSGSREICGQRKSP